LVVSKASYLGWFFAALLFRRLYSGRILHC